MFLLSCRRLRLRSITAVCRVFRQAFRSSSAQVTAFLPVGVYSSSAQLPAGIPSSSAQVIADLPPGSMSGSSQVDFGTISNKPSLFSSSLQVGLVTSASYSATSSLATAINFVPVTASYALSAGSSGGGVTGTGTSGKVAVWSGGALTSSILDDNGSRITMPFPITASFFKGDGSALTNLGSASYAPVGWNDVHNIPVALVSSSAQVIAGLPTGIVSSSGQVSYTGLTNIPVAIVSASGQVTYSGLSSIPVGRSYRRQPKSTQDHSPAHLVGLCINGLPSPAYCTLQRIMEHQTTRVARIGPRSQINQPALYQALGKYPTLALQIFQLVSYPVRRNCRLALVSSSGQVSYPGLSNIPVGIVSSSGQVVFTGLASIPNAGLGICFCPNQYRKLYSTRSLVHIQALPPLLPWQVQLISLLLWHLLLPTYSMPFHHPMPCHPAMPPVEVPSTFPPYLLHCFISLAMGRDTWYRRW